MDFLPQWKPVVAWLVVITLFGLFVQWQVLTITGRIRKESLTERSLLAQRKLCQPSPKKLFEPEVREDIQTVAGGKPRIPHIIHFIFITDLKGKSGIPAIYKDNANSFVHFNPNWTFYFWTESTARQLIATKHPVLLSTWENYTQVINKAAALRYVVLYEFGGVYADLDMQCKRPLDRATMKFACILTPEPFEHSAILYKTPFLLSNRYMMCRPNHPFMKRTMLSLLNSPNHGDLLAVAGPIFLTTQFKLYNKFKPGDAFRTKSCNESNSPYFYKGTLREDHINATYVANTRYFMYSFDKTAPLFHLCTVNVNKSRILSHGCNLLKHRDASPSPFLYTDHLWRQMYSIKDSTKMIPINNAIPKAKLKIWLPEQKLEISYSVLLRQLYQQQAQTAVQTTNLRYYINK